MGKRVGTGLPLGRLGRRRLCRVLSRTCLGRSVGCSKPAAKCCYLATNPICYHFGYEAHRRSLWAKTNASSAVTLLVSLGFSTTFFQNF